MACSFFECFTAYNTLQSMCIGNLQIYKEAVISPKLANIFLKCSLYTLVHYIHVEGQRTCISRGRPGNKAIAKVME